jgi:hypothetical protein
MRRAVDYHEVTNLNDWLLISRCLQNSRETCICIVACRSNNGKVGCLVHKVHLADLVVFVIVVFLLYAVLIYPEVFIPKGLGNFDSVPDRLRKPSLVSVMPGALYIAESDV